MLVCVCLSLSLSHFLSLYIYILMLTIRTHILHARACSHTCIQYNACMCG